jgi:hypothetical protein
MQFDDPKSILEAAAAKPSRGVDAHALVKEGARLRRARMAAAVTGLAVVVAGASASFGILRGGGDGDLGPAPVAASPDEPCERGGKNVSLFLTEDVLGREARRLAIVLDRQVRELQNGGRVVYVPAREADENEGPVRGPNVAYDGRHPRIDLHGVDEDTVYRLEQRLRDRLELVKESRAEGRGARECSGDEEGATAEYSSVRDVDRYEPADLAPSVEPELVEAECGTGPLHVSRDVFLDSPDKKWCRFEVSIANVGMTPLEFRYDDQAVNVYHGPVDPWPAGEEAPAFAGRLFAEPLEPGRTATGRAMFLLEHDAVPTRLELWGPALGMPVFVLDYDCLADLRDDTDGRCAFGGTPEPRRSLDEEGVIEISLYHCGVDPIAFAGRQWVVPDPPFDATNVPRGFSGGGWFEVTSEDQARYVDTSGIALHFEAATSWEPPPCQ